MKKIYQGFTLIELLIVVAIIGILSAIAVPNFLNAQIRSKVAATVSNMKTIITANEMYRLDYNTFLPFLDTSAVVEGCIGGLKGLTTPIAYLPWSAMTDPFASKYESGMLDQMEYDKTVDYAPSLGTRGYLDKEIFQTQEGLYYGIRADSFMLESVGPDSRYSVFPSENFSKGIPFKFFWIYDASNGLCSQGDIVRVKGCIIPELRIFFQDI